VVLPSVDSTTGYIIPTSTNPLNLYQHGFGYVAPTRFVNVGADMAVNPSWCLPPAFGYFFGTPYFRLSDDGFTISVG